jgi:hypothetical protein
MHRWLAASLLLTMAASAGPIEVTGRETATLPAGSSLLVEFSIWNYAAGSSGPPTHIGLTVLGRAPAARLSMLSDSNAGTYAGYLFAGRLESRDGSYWADFDGPLRAAPGTLSFGGGEPLDVAVLAGAIDLDQAAAERIFGDRFDARFVLRNLRDSFGLGLGNGYTIRELVWEPDVRGDGERSIAGLTGRVTIAAPEPPGWALLAGALALVALTRAGLRSLRASKR